MSLGLGWLVLLQNDSDQRVVASYSELDEECSDVIVTFGEGACKC